MKIAFSKYMLSSLLLPLAIIPCSAQKFKPSLHLARGETYYMVSTGNSAIVQVVNGHENKLNLTLSFKMAFKVTGVLDSAYQMEVSYQSLGMKIQMADTVIDMDSKKAGALDVPSSVIAAMMNRPFNITLTKSGRISSVENIEKMISGVFDGFPQIGAAKKDQIKNQFMQSFGANAFKGSLEMGTAIFPESPVAKNDTWVVNTSMEAPARASVKTTYQLIDATGNFYQIHGDGTMATEKEQKSSEINGLPMTYQLTGTNLTDIKVDKTTGWIIEIKLRQLMSGSIEILDNPKVPGGMTVPMTFKTEIVTTDK